MLEGFDLLILCRFSLVKTCAVSHLSEVFRRRMASKCPWSCLLHSLWEDRRMLPLQCSLLSLQRYAISGRWSEWSPCSLCWIVQLTCVSLQREESTLSTLETTVSESSEESFPSSLSLHLSTCTPSPSILLFFPSTLVPNSVFLCLHNSV